MDKRQRHWGTRKLSAVDICCGKRCATCSITADWTQLYTQKTVYLPRDILVAIPDRSETIVRIHVTTGGRGRGGGHSGSRSTDKSLRRHRPRQLAHCSLFSGFGSVTFFLFVPMPEDKRKRRRRQLVHFTFSRGVDNTTTLLESQPAADVCSRHLQASGARA